jgi:hypothetical protein
MTPAVHGHVISVRPLTIRRRPMSGPHNRGGSPCVQVAAISSPRMDALKLPSSPPSGSTVCRTSNGYPCRAQAPVEATTASPQPFAAGTSPPLDRAWANNRPTTTTAGSDATDREPLEEAGRSPLDRGPANGRDEGDGEQPGDDRGDRPPGVPPRSTTSRLARRRRPRAIGAVVTNEKRRWSSADVAGCGGVGAPKTEIRRLFEATGDHRLHALWVVLATTGLRLGEALCLMWDAWMQGRLAPCAPSAPMATVSGLC